MSKHSKNCTSTTVFTYAERQKLKGVYGTIETRIGQDSMKKFEMCTICNNNLIEPTSCDEGHMFCRSCIIEYLVKQKKSLADKNI
jgi:nitric oxide synthase-interacting protein